MEIWKKIEGFENYEISNLGNVKNIITNKILKQKIDTSGYLSLSLYRNKKKFFKNTHRLLAIAFIEKVEYKLFVNHKNGIKTDNRIENLEWCNQKENSQHSIKNKLQIPFKGSECGNSKLKEKDILNIRNMYSKDKISQKKIADFYNITQANICSIINKKTWKHI